MIYTNFLILSSVYYIYIYYLLPEWKIASGNLTYRHRHSTPYILNYLVYSILIMYFLHDFQYIIYPIYVKRSDTIKTSSCESRPCTLYMLSVCGEGKIAFWTFGWIFVPWGFSRRRMGTLLGTPCWGQKIILNSEYSTRVLFNRAKFFPEGPRCSWFDIFPRFHYCDRILRSTLCKNPASTPFFTTPWLPSNRVPATKKCRW